MTTCTCLEASRTPDLFKGNLIQLAEILVESGDVMNVLWE